MGTIEVGDSGDVWAITAAAFSTGFSTAGFGSEIGALEVGLGVWGWATLEGRGSMVSFAGETAAAGDVEFGADVLVSAATAGLGFFPVKMSAPTLVAAFEGAGFVVTNGLILDAEICGSTGHGGISICQGAGVTE